MSHIYRVKAKIDEIKPDVAKLAAKILGKGMKLKVAKQNAVWDYYGNKTVLGDEYVVFEYKLTGGARNFAINTETGEIVGDFYGHEQLLRDLNKKFEQSYAAAAASVASQETWNAVIDWDTVSFDETGELHVEMVVSEW